MENSSKASTDFGLDLFRLVTAKTPEANGFLSPFSISVALAMTQLGAAGETSKGMVKALRWKEGNESAIHEENQKYISLLQTSQEQYELSVANRIFVEKGYNILPAFLEQTQKLYLAEAVPSDFSTNADQERVKINTWVSEKTREKINDLIAPGILNADTRMVLVNAIYFKGKWTNPFEARSTRPRPFKISASKTKDVPTMEIEKSFRFWLDDGTEGFSVLELPYKGNGLSMVILLPKDDFGLSNMEKSLTEEKLTSVFKRLQHQEKVKVRLPKFEMTCSYKMKEPLCQMGMSLAFSSHADFSQMSPAKDLLVSEVVHKAFVKVDEEGSEAAAATAVKMMRRCMMIPMEVPEFFVDHPFLVTIVDTRSSNSVLFMGRVTDPC